MDSYEVAQICRNGHVANSTSTSAPGNNQRFCNRCGEPTITMCEQCEVAIRGHHPVRGRISFPSDFRAPAYCQHCGTAYPWTGARLDAAKELADTFEKLSENERQQLQQSLDDLTRDTPRTKVAESKFKRLIKKAGTDAYDGMKGILVEVVSETVKKSLFGG